MTPFVLGDDLREVLSATVPNLPSLITPAMFSNAIAYALPGLRDLTMKSGRYLSRQLSETRSIPVPVFERLRSLHLTAWPQDQVHTMHHISLLFTLPSLSCLALQGLALHADDSSPVSTD
jgi:hypothetical protein